MSYRPQDTNILDEVDVDNDTFQVFIDKFNWIVDHLRNTVVTVSNTSDYDGNNTGNGFVVGIFGSNTLVARNAIRGGNVSTSNTLTVSSALSVQNAATVNGTLTVTGASTVNSLAASGQTTVSNTFTVTGIANLAANASVGGNLTVVGQVTVEADYVIDVMANTNLGSNVTAPQTFGAFLKSDYTGGRLTVQTKCGSNAQIYEAVLTHAGSDPAFSVYGVVSAPSGANNGVVSATSNTTHILLQYQQTGANTSVKTVAHLVK